MLSWFRPRCPVDAREQSWIDENLAWLAGQFGLDVFLRRAVLVPKEGFFPRRFAGTEPAIHELLAPLCRQMDLKPSTVELEFFSDDQRVGFVDEHGHPVGLTAGQFEPGVVRLDRNDCHDLSLVVGMVAHELGRQRLIGESRVTGEEYDAELLADLTVVFRGLGVFHANSPRSYAQRVSV